MKKKISIIVPVYNVEKTLRRCIDSILVQTYDNIEIIFIDDATPDSSGNVCDEYGEKYDFIKVIHKDLNEGLGFARNTGLSIAEGDYVTFIDSDDEIRPLMLESMIKEIDKTGADTCLGSYTRVKNNKRVDCLLDIKNDLYGHKNINELTIRMLGPNNNGTEALEHMAAKNLYSMEVIKKFKIGFCSEREILAEDLIFSLDYMKHAKKICFSRYPGYIYYDNDNTLTTSYRKNRFDLLLNLNKAVITRIVAMGIDAHELIRFERTFLVVSERCMSQEVRYSKFHNAYKKIKMICLNDQVIEYSKILSASEGSIKEKIFCFLIKHRFIVTLYAVFYLYNRIKKG